MCRASFFRWILLLPALVLSAAEQRRIFTAKDRDVLPPRVIRRVKAEYDPAARGEKIEGTVKLIAVLSEAGTPEDIVVVESLDPRLDAKAIAAARQWRFEPAKLNGAAVRFKVMLELNFRLRKKGAQGGSR